MRLDLLELARSAFFGQPVRQGSRADLNFLAGLCLPGYGSPLPFFVRLLEYEPLYSFIAPGFAIFPGVPAVSPAALQANHPANHRFCGLFRV